MKRTFPNLFTYALDSGITLNHMATAFDTLADSVVGLFRPNLSTEAQQELQSLSHSVTDTDLNGGGNGEVHWKLNATGKFTVESAYRLLKGSQG